MKMTKIDLDLHFDVKTEEELQVDYNQTRAHMEYIEEFASDHKRLLHFRANYKVWKKDMAKPMSETEKEMWRRRGWENDLPLMRANNLKEISNRYEKEERMRRKAWEKEYGKFSKDEVERLYEQKKL